MENVGLKFKLFGSFAYTLPNFMVLLKTFDSWYLL